MVVTPMGLRFLGRVFPMRLGRGGVTLTKREGDGATPAGVHVIVGCLYRPDRLARPAIGRCRSATAIFGATIQSTKITT